MCKENAVGVEKIRAVVLGVQEITQGRENPWHEWFSARGIQLLTLRGTALLTQAEHGREADAVVVLSSLLETLARRSLTPKETLFVSDNTEAVLWARRAWNFPAIAVSPATGGIYSCPSPVTSDSIVRTIYNVEKSEKR